METGGRGAVDEQVELGVEALLAIIAANTEGMDFINKLLQVDEVGDTTYIGYAVEGTATTAATWAIKKIVIDNTNGCDAAITWADGDKSFDNIWDNRAALSYS